MNDKLTPWIEAQFKKGEELRCRLSENAQMRELGDIFEYLTLSPECNWEKARTLLEQLLNCELIEKNWQQLDYEAEHWEPGQGIFLSELLTDFGALPTAAALGAVTTTLRLITDNELRNKVELASQNWWGRLTRSLWGHGYDIYHQRFQIIIKLDMGDVLQTKQDDSWIEGLRSYFKGAISEKRENPDMWGIDALSTSVEALLRLGPICSEYQEEISALLKPQEQEKVMEAPLVKILITHFLDETDLAKLSSSRMIRVLPPHRFRAQLKESTDFAQDVESTYLLKVLMLREPLLDLMRDPHRSFSLQELTHQTNTGSVETRVALGHLLKSGLVEVDLDLTECPKDTWHDPDRKLHLSSLGSKLLAVAPVTKNP